ncbi:MAG TPA: phosphoribosylglycinamide formyltransferase [Burkholderiales bacterium]
MAPKRVVVVISGRGSNMEALLESRLPATIASVISNVPDVHGLAIARSHGISTAVINHRSYADRSEFDSALGREIDRHAPDLIVLAGFRRVLTDAFVGRYRGRMLNIHPSLLPAFPGLHTHRRALEAGVRIHGCTVHFVTGTLDDGPIVAQAAVPVIAGDTEEQLAARVLRAEHLIYPQAVRWFCEGRLRLTEENTVLIDGVVAAVGALVSPHVET